VRRNIPVVPEFSRAAHQKPMSGGPAGEEIFTRTKWGTRRSASAGCCYSFAGCLLYPLVLGAAPYDSYRWGYGDPFFLGLLLALALAGVAWRRPLVTLSISLAVLAWAAGCYESANLWDCLIDPLLSIYGACALLFAASSYWRRR
jgi:hypothetical protein